jgi:hypothetical protein
MNADVVTISFRLSDPDLIAELERVRQEALAYWTEKAKLDGIKYCTLDLLNDRSREVALSQAASGLVIRGLLFHRDERRTVESRTAQAEFADDDVISLGSAVIDREPGSEPGFDTALALAFGG